MIIGLCVNIIFSTLLILVQPYKRYDLNVLAIISTLIQTCGFLAAVSA